MSDSLIESLVPGVTLVTASRRLSRYLSESYAAEQRNRGRQVWERPDILPLTAWITRAWETVVSGGEEPQGGLALLNPEQELALWEQVVGDVAAGGGAPLLQVPAAAKLARDAWGLIRAWRCEPDDQPEWQNADTRMFLDWAREFTARCRRQSWLDGASLTDRVIAAVAQGQVELPQRLLLAGFDELNPQQQALVDAIGSRGCTVAEHPLPVCDSNAARVALPESEAELLTAARWCRRLLEQGVAGPIGVVVPELNAARADVARLFEDVFTPAAVIPGGEPTPLYNISLGIPLAEVPVVRDALLMLGLAARRVPLAELSSLLRSPFLAGAQTEVYARAALDARLRRRGEAALSTARVAFYARGDGDADATRCPQLVGCIERLVEPRAAAKGRKRTGAWAVWISRWFVALGWPGERSLDHREYQAVEALRELLSDFAGLDGLVGEIGLERARGILRRMAAERVFQPKSDPAPVQVLGTLEATGLVFTHLWVTGLHDDAWPQPPQPNPFLPAGIQRRRGLPHAGAERELAFARTVTERLLASAPTVVVSYPQRDGDAELRPSPLVAALPSGDADALVGHVPPLAYRFVHTHAPRLETLTDDSGPRWRDGQPVPGGTGVFKDQAACPFRAFAVRRLGAQPLELPQAGLDASARGDLVHQVLARVWTTLKKRSALLALDDEAERAVVQDAVNRVLDESAGRWPETLQGRFLELERARLVALTREWLAVDRERPEFEVLAPEQRDRVELGTLGFEVRLDRIDRSAAGVVLLDYKTGQPNPRDWFGPRPEEPQLPVYAVTHREPVAGIAYAVVRRGNMKLTGVGASGDLGEGFSTPVDSRIAEAQSLGDWAALLANWKQNLTALAEAFCAGDARVDPKDDRSCTYCHLHPLCRIHERGHRPLDAWEVET